MNQVSKESPATLADAALAPEDGRCLLCNRPLGADPHFITELPDGEHSSCREITLTGAAFPFDAQIDRLRRLARMLKNQLAMVVETGKWIVTIKSQWPKTRGAFEIHRVERIRKLKSGLTILHAELGRFGRRNWF